MSSGFRADHVRDLDTLKERLWGSSVQRPADSMSADADLRRHMISLHAGADFIGVFRAAIVHEGLQAGLFAERRR